MSGWTIIPLQRSLGEYAASWDRLNAEICGDHPLLTSLFINGMLQHFGDGAEHLCVFREHGQVQAMCVLRPRNWLVWTSFQPSQAQLAATLLANPAALDTLLASLPGMVIQLDLTCNDPMFGKALEGAPRTNLLNHALTMKVDLDGTYASYWSSRSKQLQSNMKQRDKRMADDGVESHLVKISDPAGVLEGVDRYAVLECAGWKGANGTALGSTREQHQFYRDLMLGAAAEGQAFVFELWFGDRLAASRLVISRNGMWVILKTSYDEGLAEYSPGRLLLRRVIADGFATAPGGAIEFYTDADANQLEWATGDRWIQHRTLYRGHMAEALSIAKRAIRRERNDADGLAVEVFTSPDDLPADVQRCMIKAEKRNVSFGFAWYRNLVETVYPKHSGIRFYILRRKQNILAIVPLRAERVRKGWQLSALSNFYTSLYDPILEAGLKSDQLVPLLTAMERDFPRLASLKMAPMDPCSHGYQTLIGAMHIKGWVQFEYFTFGNWYQAVESDWAKYLSGRPGTLQNTIRRMGRKFAADKGVLEIITSPKDMPRAIAAYEQVYAASWKRTEAYPGFMPGLMRVYAEKGSLRMGIAWMDGQPVAAQVWIVSHGRAEIYKLAYDERFKHYSPGTLLSALLMERVIEKDKVIEVDYLIGDDAYKKTWMSQRRERWGLVAYNPRSAHGMAGLARESAWRLVKMLRERGGEKKSAMARMPSRI